MLDLDGIDIEEIATALADQTDYEHRWLVDPRTGEVAFWTSDTGIDGQNPVELDELDLIPSDPLPPYAWFRDMADFAEGISDTEISRRLTQSLRGRGAFRRFKNEVYENYPELISLWQALRDVRAQRRAVEWLLDQGLVNPDAAQQFASEHPDPDPPELTLRDDVLPAAKARHSTAIRLGSRPDHGHLQAPSGYAAFVAMPPL